MVIEDERKKQVKRWTLEFGIKYGVWQKPPSIHSLGESYHSLNGMRSLVKND